MGEMADDIIDGTVCQECGMFFRDVFAGEYMDAPGYPRTCNECDTKSSHKLMSDADWEKRTNT